MQQDVCKVAWLQRYRIKVVFINQEIMDEKIDPDHEKSPGNLRTDKRAVHFAAKPHWTDQDFLVPVFDFVQSAARSFTAGRKRLGSGDETEVFQD